MTRKIMTSFLVIAVTAVMVGAGTFAYFSDTETSTGNTFTAGTLDLQVDGEDDGATVYALDIEPMAPGDWGENTWIAENIGSITGDLSLTVSGIVNNDNGLTEPETAVDSPDGLEEGELGANLYVELWVNDDLLYDGFLNDMPGTYADVYTLAQDDTVDVYLYWEIDSGVGNIIQSDSASFNIEFSLNQQIST